MRHHVGTLWARSGLALTVVRRLCGKLEPRIEQARRWVTKPSNSSVSIEPGALHRLGRTYVPVVVVAEL